MECNSHVLSGFQTIAHASFEKEKEGLLQGEYGVITDIQRYSVHDGPGIRTLVFLKGCPMSCIWCQNPESNSIHRELMYREEKCISCGACVKSCDKNAVLLENERITIKREKCDLCGKCVDSCYAGSLDIIGRVVSVQEVVEEVMKDEVFYRHSGGGVTLSGGEVTFQYKFAAKILEGIKAKGINTAIETAGFCSWEVMEEVIRSTDFVLFDIKHLDDEMHKKYTGVSNARILENIKQISKLNKKLIVRVPLIPNVNDAKEHIKRVAEFTKSLNAVELHILPFHQAGKSKWAALDKNYLCANWDTHSVGFLEELLEEVKSKGVQVSIGGGGIYDFREKPSNNFV